MTTWFERTIDVYVSNIYLSISMYNIHCIYPMFSAVGLQAKINPPPSFAGWALGKMFILEIMEKLS